MGTVPM